MLDKYLGDGLMAVFGMTQAQLEPEVSAVRAGLEMLDKLDDINRSHSDRIEIGVGVNTGMVMAGYVGTDERVEFTVLGDAVNVAFRLEALARPNRLVIGPGTTGAITGRFNLQRVGAVDLKGRQQPVQAHEVLRGPVRQAQPDAGDDVQAIT
jgi:adenylate cyclase